MKYTITNINEINDKVISDDVFEKELVNYRIIDRETEIDNLINWIGETKDSSDKIAMKEDLKYLIKLNDKYLLSSILTNAYLRESEDEGQEILEGIYNI